MKWMIASDLHGSERACREMLAAFQREGADRLLLLGDILYHGPRNDLPEGYAPKAVIEALNGYADRIYCVRGNCDAEVDQMVLRFPIMADYLLLPVGERLIFATHGHVYNADNLPPLRPGDVLLHGHTHLSACEVREGSTSCNPGSVALPIRPRRCDHLRLRLTGTGEMRLFSIARVLEKGSDYTRFGSVTEP